MSKHMFDFTTYSLNNKIFGAALIFILPIYYRYEYVAQCFKY